MTIPNASYLSWVVTLLLFVLLVQPTSAVYQDEAYSIDYAHTLLGTPIRRNTFFHKPDKVSKATLLYTLSEKGVIGAVNPRDGELVWRFLADDVVRTGSNGSSHGFLRAHPSSTTIVSATGSTIRAWDSRDGRLVWEWAGPGVVKSLEVLALDGAQGDVIVVTEKTETASTVSRLSSAEGTVKWQSFLDKADFPLGVSASASALFCSVLSSAMLGGYKIKVFTLDPATGKETSHYTLATENEVSSAKSILHLSGTTTAPIVAWADEKVKMVKINVLGYKHTITAMVNPYGTDEIVSVLFHEPSATVAVPHFLLQINCAHDHRAEVYHIETSSGKASKAYDLPKVAGHGILSASVVEEDVYFTRQTDSETIIVSSLSHGILERFVNVHKMGLNEMSSAGYSITELASKSANKFSVRSAFVDADGDWHMVQNGNLAWTRHEGLAGIVAAEFVDIPVEESLVEELASESHSNALAAYFHRVRRHVKDLQHLPDWIQRFPTRFLGSLIGIDLGSSSPLEHDSFGYNKIILVATETGRIAAISSGMHGQLLWSVRGVAPPEGKRWDVRIIDVRGTKAYILIKGGEIMIIDAVTGTTVQHLPATTPGLSHHVPLTTSTGHRSLVPIKDDGSPGHLPDGTSDNAYLVTQRPDGSVAGWKYTANGRTTLVWNFTPKVGEVVISLTTRPAHDPVASIGRALGDRSVLYKYLSSNLILVTASSVVASTLSLYLLDSISGQVLYSTTHHNALAGNTVPLVFSENWFAYSFFSDSPANTQLSGSAPSVPIKAQQLVVAEMFESPVPNDRGPLGSSLNYSSMSGVSTPYVISAAFVVPAPINTLATTSTIQGITPRSLLAYSPTLAALIGLPVALLSPRRPVGRDPTPAEREEGLPAYQPHLEFAPAWFLSHKRELLGINDIITTPSQMESTSLVFAYGDVDIFGTRVAPIGTFDVLGKGFGKAQLLLTIVALSVGTALLSPMATKKRIDTLWRS